MAEIMDEFGGILTGGLLGNPILAQFNLNYLVIEVIEDPNGGGGKPSRGGAGGVGFSEGWRNNFGFKPREREKKPETADKVIAVTMMFRGTYYRKEYTVSDGTAQVSINIVNTLNDLKDRAIKIKRIFIREKQDIKPTVRIIKDDRD